MSIFECPNCKTPVSPEDYFCEVCGTSLRDSTKDCEKCGAPAAISAEGYCDRCGFRRAGADERVEIKFSPNLVGISDRGLQHLHNQDAVALQIVGQVQILAVCDGVSSAYTPELAAQTAAQTIVQTVCRLLADQTEPDPQAMLGAAIAQAQAAVSALPYPQSEETQSAPATTLVAAIVRPHVATIGWLGDSRAYWVSAGRSEQITEDDSWVNEVVSAGKLSLAEAQQDSLAHAITRWLGADAEDELPRFVTLPISSPGYLILCSDGLWNYLEDSLHLLNLIPFGANVHAIAQHLVEYAKSCGGHDNITVAVLFLDVPESI